MAYSNTISPRSLSGKHQSNHSALEIEVGSAALKKSSRHTVHSHSTLADISSETKRTVYKQKSGSLCDTPIAGILKKTVVPTTPVATYSSATNDPSETIKRALEQGNDEAALSLCAYLSYTKANTLSAKEKTDLPVTHKRIVHLCTPGQQATHHNLVGSNLSLGFLHSELLAEREQQHIEALKKKLCSEGDTGQHIQESLKEIQILIQKKHTDTILRISELYRLYRPLMTQEQLSTLAQAYRETLPALLTKCSESVKHDTTLAGSLVQNHIACCIDLINHGVASGEGVNSLKLQA